MCFFSCNSHATESTKAAAAEIAPNQEMSYMSATRASWFYREAGRRFIRRSFIAQSTCAYVLMLGAELRDAC